MKVQAGLLWDRIGYINHGEFGFGQDIIFQEAGQLVEDFSPD